MSKEYTRESLTVEDVRRVLDAGGYWLRDGEWDGSDPVKASGVHPLTPFAGWNVTITVDSILDWLNHESGFFDPVALGM